MTIVNIIALGLFIISPKLYAQSFSTNIKLSTEAYSEVSLNGGAKSIAVLNDNVYAIWQGKHTDSKNNIYFAKSVDGGITFLPEKRITQAVNKENNLFPSLAVNSSGNIYVAWTKVTTTQDSIFIGPRKFKGYMDEIRVWKDTALWTSNFTPPSSAYKKTNNPKLKLFLNMEDDKLSDSSLSNHITKTHGNLKRDIAVSKFGDGSAYFDGIGATYLSVPVDNDFSFGTSDFTIDYWVRFETLSVLDFVFATSVDGTGNTGSITGTAMNFYYYHPQKTLNYYNKGAYIGSTSNNWSPTVNQWYHVAGVRNGSSWKVFIDGILINSGTNASSVDPKFDEKADIVLSRSVDGGNAFQTPVQVTTNNESVYPCIGAHNNNVYIFYADKSNYPKVNYYFVRSADNGGTMSTPVQINDVACVESIEFDGVASMDLDTQGNIYLAWVDGRRINGNGDIYFAKSTDDGLNFSANVMVNDINQEDADSVQYMPSVAADDNDNVYVSFTDKRLGSDNWENNRVYLAKSDNGGSSFTPETLLAGHNATSKHHNIVAKPGGKLYAAICTHIAPGRNVWLFESSDGGSNYSAPVAISDLSAYNYSDIRVVSDSDNNVYALWKDDRAGSENIYFARTDIATSFSENNNYYEYILYPNPTRGQVSVITPDNNMDIELTVYNLQGQVVYRKANINTSVISLDLKIPGGTYFVNINSKNVIKTLKLIKY